MIDARMSLGVTIRSFIPPYISNVSTVPMEEQTGQAKYLDDSADNFCKFAVKLRSKSKHAITSEKYQVLSTNV